MQLQGDDHVDDMLMPEAMTEKSTLLLIDTVGDAPGAVLIRGDHVLASAEFPLRSASATLTKWYWSDATV